jgi:iron complex outermembrane recepter protein
MKRGRSGGSWGPAVALSATVVLVQGWGLTPVSARAPDFTELTVEQLMNIEVTSVSKRPEPRSEAPAAVYVITQDDIRRAGVTSIPEALRLAPGVEVAKVDSNKWAIGIRGFASRLARSVLVLIDGRSVYTPLFAGTYWEVQDLLLDDINRIEVIRGPGGTLWGANAFNGVINIITKNAQETQGALVTAGGGSEEQGFVGTRYGGRIGTNAFYRLYGKFFNRDGGFDTSGDVYDVWHMGQGGFRVDWNATEVDSLKLQGDLYEGETGQRTAVTPGVNVEKYADVSGGNVLGRWSHTLSPTSDLSVKLYYDHTFRREPTFHDELNTFDFDGQHHFRLPGQQEIVWGFNFRYYEDRTGGGSSIRFVPPDRSFNLVSGFLQDEIAVLDDQLRLTVGSKLEHNDFSGFEYQPSGRLLWAPQSWQALWAAVSRAVRTPSRIEDGFMLDAPPFRLIGDGHFVSEKVLAYELGHRIQPVEPVFIDTALFYNRYTDLLSLETGLPFPEAQPPPPHMVVPIFIRNKLDGESYGFEVAADAVVNEWWRLHASYAYLQVNLQRDADSNDTLTQRTARDSAHNMFALRSNINLPGRWEIDTNLRYVEGLPNQHVEGYSTLDVRLAKAVTEQLELAAVGQNLLQAHHSEFGGGTQVERGAFGQMRWQW